VRRELDCVLYILWLRMLLIEDVFAVLNALVGWNDVFKSKGMIVIILIYRNVWDRRCL